MAAHEQKMTPWWAMDDIACCEVLKFLVPAKDLEFHKLRFDPACRLKVC